MSAYDMDSWHEGQKAAYRRARWERGKLPPAEYARVDAMCRKMISDNPTFYKNWWSALGKEERRSYLYRREEWG